MCDIIQIKIQLQKQIQLADGEWLNWTCDYPVLLFVMHKYNTNTNASTIQIQNANAIQ